MGKPQGAGEASRPEVGMKVGDDDFGLDREKLPELGQGFLEIPVVPVVVEIAQEQTGQTTSTGVAYSFGPVALGTSSASPVFGTSVTYLCREPASTALNESVIQMASADMVGRRCRSDDECGPLFCNRAEPSAEFGACAAQGGGPGAR